MDPISLIVSALAAGASAALKPTAEKAVKDAYEGIKALIKRKYERVSVDMIEMDPSDVTRQEILSKDLSTTDAARDDEVLTAAQSVIAAVERHAPDAAQEAGIDLRVFEVARNLNIKNLTVGSGTAIRGENWKVGGDANIEGISAGRREDAAGNPTKWQ